jgi:hypothetical protein
MISDFEFILNCLQARFQALQISVFIYTIFNLYVELIQKGLDIIMEFYKKINKTQKLVLLYC